jgi:hypothetical protein
MVVGVHLLAVIQDQYPGAAWRRRRERCRDPVEAELAREHDNDWVMKE